MQFSLRTLLIGTALIACYVALARRYEWLVLGPPVVFGPVIFFYLLLFRASHISRLRWPWRLSLAWLETTLILAVIAGSMGMGVDTMASPSRVPIEVEKVKHGHQFFRIYGFYSFVVSGSCAAMTAIPVLAKWFYARGRLRRPDG